jgi:hypothetical protein
MKQRNADKKLAKRQAEYEQALRSKDGSSRHQLHKPGSRKRG